MWWWKFIRNTFAVIGVLSVLAALFFWGSYRNMAACDSSFGGNPSSEECVRRHAPE